MKITDKTGVIMEMKPGYLTPAIWDFVRENETEADALKRWELARAEDVDLWAENCAQYPCGQYEQYYKVAKEKRARVVTFGEFKAEERRVMLAIPIREISAEDWEERLNVLPPKMWMDYCGVNMFCMSEHITGPYTEQFGRYNGRHFCKTVDVTDRETWINHAIYELLSDEMDSAPDCVQPHGHI